MFKRYLVIIFSCLILLCGCTQTQNPTSPAITNENTATATENTAVTTEDATVAPSEEVSDNIVPTQTATPEPKEIFGFVTSVNDGNIVINECERIFHSADDIGTSGQPYGNDWLEIVHKSNKVTLKLTDSAQYYYADLMQQGVTDDKPIQSEAITMSEFSDICMGNYYGNLYYFDFVYCDGTLIKAEFYLNYYIAG